MGLLLTWVCRRPQEVQTLSSVHSVIISILGHLQVERWHFLIEPEGMVEAQGMRWFISLPLVRFLFKIFIIKLLKAKYPFWELQINNPIEHILKESGAQYLNLYTLILNSILNFLIPNTPIESVYLPSHQERSPWHELNQEDNLLLKKCLSNFWFKSGFCLLKDKLRGTFSIFKSSSEQTWIWIGKHPAKGGWNAPPTGGGVRLSQCSRWSKARELFYWV